MVGICAILGEAGRAVNRADRQLWGTTLPAVCFWPGAAVAHTRLKRTLEKGGISRRAAYWLNCEFTLSAKSGSSQKAKRLVATIFNGFELKPLGIAGVGGIFRTAEALGRSSVSQHDCLTSVLLFLQFVAVLLYQFNLVQPFA